MIELTVEEELRLKKMKDRVVKHFLSYYNEQFNTIEINEK